MNVLDIFLALPLLGVVLALFRDGTVVVSLVRVAVLLGALFAALAFYDFPAEWTDGSLLYAPLKQAVDYVMKVCGAL